MRVRFIGDPNLGGDGPAVMTAYGLTLPKGEWVDVESVPAKLRGNSHYEVEADRPGDLPSTQDTSEAQVDEDNGRDPLDHDGDGKKGGSLTKAEIVERLKAAGATFDGRASRDALAAVLASAELAPEPDPEA